MKAKEETIGYLLKMGRFRVPPFQRRYSWRQREFERLWQDIEALVTGDAKRHFMGTVVLESMGDGRQFAVIDGQQRIATFTIVLVALREVARLYRFSLRGGQIASRLWRDQSPRFIPSLHDKDAFDYLLENPALLKKGAHKSVWAAYEFFLDRIRNFIDTVPGQKPTHFRKILAAVNDRMNVVTIQLAASDDAQGVFESINYVGVPLTAADLARNFVLSKVRRGEEQQRINHDYWQRIESSLEESIEAVRNSTRRKQLQRVLPEFLRAMLIVERGKYISFSDLYRELRLFYGSGRLEQKLELTLKYADTFSRFLNPLLEPKKLLKDRLENFTELRMTTHYPILLVIYRALDEGRLTVRSASEAMRSIESFVVRRAFNSKVSRDLNQIFAKVAADLQSETKRMRVDRRLAALLARQRWPSNQEFASNFVSSPIYSNAREIAKYALVTIERAHPGAKERVLDGAAQIEHIFPQQPGRGWLQKDLASLKRSLHAIGNLTLTRYNASYSNRSFEEKLRGKDGYKKSPYWLNRSVCSAREWNGEAVDRRGKRLLREAVKLWPGPGRG